MRRFGPQFLRTSIAVRLVEKPQTSKLRDFSESEIIKQQWDLRPTNIGDDDDDDDDG